MDFRALQLSDIELFRSHFLRLKMQTCDYSVGGMFMWRNYFRMEYAEQNGILISRLRDKNGKAYYNLPLAEDMDAALAYTVSALSENGSISFCTVPKAWLLHFDALGYNYSLTTQDVFADYVYAAEDLITLAGKKFAGQRNQIHQFERNIKAWSFEPLTPENLPAVRAYYADTHAYAEETGDSKSAENNIVYDVLDHMDMYRMPGGVLYADGKIVGFSIGEKIGDVLFTHIEKADRTCKGAYQMLVNRFSAMYGDDVKYINREDDAGDAGLRAAKLAYHPITLLEKYIVEVKTP